MKTIITLGLIILNLLATVFAQAQNKIVLQEHFTNTLCSVCASRNPGLYTNLASQQDVLHIAYHPSRPYAGCLLNQHNKVENDARTNFYGIYGSTPRIVINGVVQSASADYSSADIFNPFKNINADLSIVVKQTLGTDSIRSTIVVKKLTSTTLSNLKLHIMYVEDTLFYNAPNGENRHYDVFRKSANGIQGIDFTAPANMNDSSIVYTSTAINSAWNKNRMYTLAFVQNTNDKTILNASKSESNKSANNSLKNLSELGIEVYPNPTNQFVNIQLNKAVENKITLINMLGVEVLNKQINNTETIDLIGFAKGIYFLQIENELGKAVQKIVLQ